MNGEEMKAYVLLARNGDTAAFCKLYELYYKDMYRFAYYMLGNPADAEDAISETVLDAFSGIKGLKKPESFKSWIFKILSTKCKRQQAVYATNRQYVKDDADLTALAKEDRSYADILDVRSAFLTLSEMEKHVISLLVFAGLTSRETAKLIGSPEGTIRSLKSRAITKMSKYLTE